MPILKEETGIYPNDLLEAPPSEVHERTWLAMVGSDDWGGTFRESAVVTTNRFYRARTR